MPAAVAAGLLALAGCSEHDDPDDRPDIDAVRAGALATVDADATANPGAPVGVGFPGGVDAGIDAIEGVDAGEEAIAELPADDDPPARAFGPVDVPGDTRRIAGLYDASLRRPSGIDVRYVLITPGGTFTLYDYDLDPHGTGLNCYRDGRPLPLVRDRDDDYLLDGRSVRISRETLGIGFGYTDTLDDDRDGDSTDFVYYRYPRVAGLSAIDLNACV